MKTLEKKELKNISGGVYILNCSSIGFNRTHCSFINGNTTCEGIYTWGGTQISIECGNIEL